jgi:tRNA (guanine37-N1)-methyltransferase
MSESIMKNAVENNFISLNTYNIRDYSNNKHKKVDDYPFGGGVGMLMTPQPIMDCFYDIKSKLKTKKPKVVYLTPRGRVFNQSVAKEFAKEEEIVFLCGRYEGIDQRVIDEIVTDEISIGDFVLTGGELPALIMIDSISRLIKGVLGKEESFMEESFSNNLLEHDQYTRPRIFEEKEVPQVLLSGNHKLIEEWKLRNSIKNTLLKRPDIIDKKKLDKKELKILRELQKELEK